MAKKSKSLLKYNPEYQTHHSRFDSSREARLERGRVYAMKGLDQLREAETQKRGERNLTRRSAQYDLIVSMQNYLNAGKPEKAYEVMQGVGTNVKDWLPTYSGNITSIKREIKNYKINRAKNIAEIRQGKESALQPMTATASIMFLICSMFFFGINITGAVIGNLGSNDFQIIGVALFTLGLIATMVFFRLRK